MRILAFVEYTAMLVGAIGMVAAKFYALPNGTHLGLFLIGAGIALGGLESIFTRQMSFRFSSTVSEDYSGLPAVAWGLMTLLIGGAVIASAYLMQSGSWYSTLNFLSRRPGPVIAAGGFLSIGTGILLMIDPQGKRGIWRMLLVRLPKTFLGVALIVAGLAAVGLGIWEWFEPRGYNQFVRDAWNQIRPWTLNRLLEELRRLWR